MVKSILVFILVFSVIFTTGISAEEDRGEIPAKKSSNDKSSCIECHKKLSWRLKNPVFEWQKSIHASTGNRCNICHGGNHKSSDKLVAKSRKYNFIAKPDRKIITEFCGWGGCHATALEQFKRGPHYISVIKTNQPNCTTCHGTHNIQLSSIDVITDKSCNSCHPAEYSRDIVKLISEIDKSISDVNNNIKFLLSKHADVRKLVKRLDNARHMFHQFVHVFSREDMKSTKKILELEIKNLDGEIKSKVALIKRLDMLYLSMLIVGLVIICGMLFYIIVMYSKRKW